MSSFFQLIQNENMKIYRKGANRIMVLMLLGLIIAGGLIIKFSGPDNTDAHKGNWKQELVQDNKDMEKQLKEMPAQSQTYFKKEIAINKYRIAHNLPPAQGENIWGFVKDMIGLIMVISIFTIIVVGTSISSEFNWGTIKLLLIRPVSRTSVIFAKYISSLMFAIGMLILLGIVSWLVGGILFGFADISQPFLQYTDGKVTETSWVMYVLKQYGLNCVQLIMMATLAGAIAAIFRNGALSIGLTIFLMMAGSTITAFLAKYDWVKYVLFANMDLSQYLNGTPLNDDMTLGFSVIVLVVYYVIFMIFGWLFFTKRDIAA
ncbi:ABC-2 type transport system permease protein [Scopulibacillus darangshiensis]|uniref:ABC-2 type transport system permease protein n=1 Tax=Scopulibacillus darangshiensis TaxID=442528 RepID=A0A4R2P946_9BACL|nr:ABC transporter permease subunit [Scopulibacillus darangshiensis]TCP30581.1 ABC-2 type transport system permease protein [Scopulibacillus darangshiensis]